MPFDMPKDTGVLRFTTAGSVDDGKSTLIGRLLYDAHAVPKDQIAALERHAARQGEEAIDFSLLTDGLSEEREQGITIDVAYRYFSTPRRKFIVADTPGHEQYTRNMVTGASTADAAVILVDVRKGATAQTRRHLYLSHLLGIPHLVVAINKMDLVDFAQSAYDSVVASILPVTTALGAASPHFVPLSAKEGDNVVHASTHMGWYPGKPLLALLEELPSALAARDAPFRFPVQLIRRVKDGGGQRRLLLGRIESGRVRVGDEILVLPAGTATRICTISTYDGSRDMAVAPSSVALEVEDPVDVARGTLLAHSATPSRAARELQATICWFDDAPYETQGRYLLKSGTGTFAARITELTQKVNIAAASAGAAAASLSRNDIARVRLTLATPIAFDAYRDNRATGAFILINADSHTTAGAGMIDA